MSRSLLVGMAAIVAATSLAGCTDFRRALGMEKAPPDEFTVVQNAPLTLPPDYGLRPPRSAGRPATPSPMQDARVAVFKAGTTPAPAAGSGASEPTEEHASPGEEAILAKAGATGADPHIRQEVDAEVQQVANASSGFVESLLFWKERPTPGEPVDAAQEAQRLRAAEAAGKPVTADQPTVERTHRTILEGLF